MADNIRYISGYSRFKSVLKERIPAELYREVREYAANHSVDLSDFADYTGNVEYLKHIIDKISNVAMDFPKILTKGNRVVLKLHYEDNDDFAGTDNHTITLNGLYLNDTKESSKLYAEREKENFFVRGTSFDDVIFHELGHVVCNVYGFQPLEIAKDILKISSTPRIAEYVKENLSIYSASTFISTTGKANVFDGTEIIAECFCAYYGNTENEFAKLYVEMCRHKATERSSI